MGLAGGRVGHHPQVLRDSEVGENATPLRHRTHTGACQRISRGAIDMRAGDMDAARRRGDPSVDGFERRRLACAVWAEEREHRPRWDNEADAAENLDAPVAGVQIDELDGGRGHAGTLVSAPRYAAWTRASAWISAGVPCAINRPKSRTWMRRHTRMTSSTSCSTSRMAMSWAANSMSRSPNASVSVVSKPEPGSSRSSRRGLVAKARPS